MNLLDKYLSFLIDQIIRDSAYFDQWFMYLIFPAVFYFVFLIIKYAALTVFIWMPINLIFGGLRGKTFNLLKIDKTVKSKETVDEKR